jgi:hypothetical protein
MTKKLKSHFTKHFRMKFGEVDAEFFLSLVKLKFAGDLLPFAFCKSLMTLTPGWKGLPRAKTAAITKIHKLLL